VRLNGALKANCYQDALVEVKDPTATAEATIHRELLDKLNQQPLQGSVLHVKSISVWSPPPARKVHHLVITAANLIAHYPVDSLLPQVAGVDTSTYSLLSPYSLKVTDAELEAKSPSKIARSVMPKMANNTAGTPKRSFPPVAPPKTNGSSVFDMIGAQPKAPLARSHPVSPAPKAPPKYGGTQTPGPSKAAPNTPYRPSPAKQQNTVAPVQSNSYRPAPAPNQIVNNQPQPPTTPTRPNPPYHNNPPQSVPKQSLHPMQAPYNAFNQANQPVNNQPNNQGPLPNNGNVPRQQQPLRRSPQDFPQPVPSNATHVPPPNYVQPNSVNNYNNPPQPPNAQPYPQPHTSPPYNSPAPPRTYNPPINTAQFVSTPINTNLPSQTPTSSVPISGLSHATANLSGSISNFSRSGNSRFLAGMAANNVWGNPTLNTSNATPQSTSGQIMPESNNRR